MFRNLLGASALVLAFLGSGVLLGTGLSKIHNYRIEQTIKDVQDEHDKNNETLLKFAYTKEVHSKKMDHAGDPLWSLYWNGETRNVILLIHGTEKGKVWNEDGYVDISVVIKQLVAMGHLHAGNKVTLICCHPGMQKTIVVDSISVHPFSDAKGLTYYGVDTKERIIYVWPSNDMN